MKKFTLALTLVTILSASTFAMANAEFDSFNYIDTKNNFAEKNSDNKLFENKILHKTTEINLSEKMGITTNDNFNNQNEVQNLQTRSSLTNTEIDLSDTFPITENSPDTTAFLILKQNSEMKTTIERFSTMDRIRFNGKTLVNDDPLSTKYETFRQILDNNVLYFQVNGVQKDLQSVFSDIHSLQFQISQNYV